MPRFFLAGLLGAVLLASGCASPSRTAARDADAVRAVLQQQVDAWNAGDLVGYMDGYARSDSLRFASGGRVRYGWRPTLDGYRRGYPDRAAMGTLTFSDLDVRVLPGGHALAFGRWALAYPDGAREPAGGLFTLLFERRPEGWRIVHDHTSSGLPDPPPATDDA